MARTAEHALREAIRHLKVAVANLPREGDTITSDAAQKALIKANTAHVRVAETYNRERLRVAEQVVLEIPR